MTATALKAATALQPALLKSFYAEMQRIRVIEEEIADRYAEQKMRCPVHLSIGQEAVPVAVSALLSDDDQVVSTHRCHAHYLAKGGDLNAMMAEMHGKAPGCCGGRGGSMHLFDHKVGMLMSLPIVASSIPIGVGAAYGMKQQGKDSVCVVYLGDASVEEGVFHESANFAQLHKIPVIFLCENNLYSVYTHLGDRQPDRPLTQVAASHDLPTDHVDGNDVAAVHAAAEVAIDRARSGRGPSFLVADTYRWREHCGPNYDNDIGYRSEEEFQAWRVLDPIERLRRQLIDSGDLDDAGAQALTDGFKAEIDAAFDFAENAPYPEGQTAAGGVYA